MARETAPFPTGWVHDPVEVRRIAASLPMPFLAQAAPGIRGSGAGKDVYLYKAWKDVNGSYVDYPAQTIGDCFVAGTMVLGEFTRAIEDVKIGDRVWTAEGNLTTVISTRQLQTARPLVEIRPVGALPITCTADHQFLVYRFRRVHGKRLTPNYYRRAMSGGHCPDRQAAIACYEGRHPEWVSAGELRDTDCLLTPIHRQSLPTPESPNDLLATEAGRFAAGYFLGNGYASSVSIEFALPSDSAVTERLIETFRLFGFNPKFDRHATQKAERVRVHSTVLAGWFRSHFYEDAVKSFPGWMIGDQSFLDGLYAADGHGDDRTDKVDSTSRSIIDAAYASLVSLGYAPTVAEMCRSEGTFANAKPLYRLTWMAEKKKQLVWSDDQFVCRPVRSTRLIEGPATVHDIGVADPHHSFLANGMAAHNCVSQGHGHGIDLLECVQIALGHKSEEFKQTSTEAIYGMCRVDIGGQRGSHEDGAVGAWAAKAISELGTVSRDVTGPYDGRKAKQWGADGVPADVKAKAAEHPVKTVSLVTTWAELEDALANGYPITVCSNQGFTMTRDADGFCRPSGHWGHCMLICGVRTDKPGALIFQSWGSMVPDGPLVLDQPDNSFWAPRRTVEAMLGLQDSWALSNFLGYPGQVLPDHWTYEGFA